MITAKQFRDQSIGKAMDVDGVAGVQCVDLFKQFCALAGIKTFALGGSGYAEEIVKRFDAIGLGKNFVLVKLADAQYGDWVIWGKGSKETPVSHVAMFESWQGSSRILVLGQNQMGQKATNEGSISTQGILGVLRLKAWMSNPQPLPTKQTTKTPQKSNDVIAREVLKGIWGNGIDRKNRLTAAGYDPIKIQALVNQLLK